MSKMYSRYNISFMKAKMCLKSVGVDEAYLDSACFDTQQALEFLIKAILEDNGIKYGRTHDIGELLISLKEIPFTIEKQDDLELLADTITSWEEGSRYGKGIRTTVQTVQRVHNLIKSIDNKFIEIQTANNDELND